MTTAKSGAASGVVHNHFSAKLSELDLRIIRSVPPGGNWKSVPEEIPSQRLQQIRESYARGEGGRSTYYGRLHPDKPAFTVSTYFNRPGNGAFTHYAEDRMISQREAARLQSFPDGYCFHGNATQVNKQIGNAVPPFLAYLIGRSLGEADFVDLFAGAGGLSLGLTWAGWKHLVAVEIESTFATTYRTNLFGEVFVGDLSQPSVHANLVLAAQEKRTSSRPMFVVGGPPCQGFSTAGNRRSLADERNHLFGEFVAALEALQPYGFIFENVPGILSFNGGDYFNFILEGLAKQGHNLRTYRLHADAYGIPQRRQRVIVIGLPPGHTHPDYPPICSDANSNLFGTSPLVTVMNAIDDLPGLNPGESAAWTGYRHAPTHPYQAFMRGDLTPAEYLGGISKC